MHHWQNLGAAFMLVTASIGAQAAEKNWAVEGSGLKIAQSCARSVDIQPSGSGHQVVIAATADKDDEINQLRVSGGSAATIELANSHCFSSSGFFGFNSNKPSLALTIKVPDGAAIEVRDGGIVHYSIGAVGGALNLSLSGASGLKAAGATTLSFELSGAGNAEIGEAGNTKLRTGGKGDVTIHALKGTMDATIAGAGNLTVDSVESPSVELHAAGRSEIRFAKGSIAFFDLDSAGASDAVIDAAVGDAKVSLSGAGDVQFAKLTGHLTQSVAGVGSVKVLDH